MFCLTLSQQLCHAGFCRPKMVDLDSGDLNTTGDAARLIEIIDNIDVDEDGHWKTLLLNDIMSVVKNTVSEKVAKKAVFTVGPEEISTSEGTV